MNENKIIFKSVAEYLETQVRRLEDMRHDINTKCMRECNSIIENIKHTIVELKKLEE